MSQAATSPMYFVVLGLLCGLVSFRLGWRIGGRIALPAIQIQLGFIAFAASWRIGGPVAAACAAIAWAAGTTVLSVYAFSKDLPRATELVAGAASHQHVMLEWLKAGRQPSKGPGAHTGARGGVAGVVSRTVRTTALFLVAATLTGGAAAMAMGTLLLNATNVYVAKLMVTSSKPDVTRFLAWSPWNLAQAIALAALGSACAAPLAYRLGYLADLNVLRILLVVGGSLLAISVLLELTLSSSYRQRLNATLEPELDGALADSVDSA